MDIAKFMDFQESTIPTTEVVDRVLDSIEKLAYEQQVGTLLVALSNLLAISDDRKESLKLVIDAMIELVLNAEVEKE